MWLVVLLLYAQVYSSSYVYSYDTCAATVKYDCTTGINNYLQWEVSSEGRVLYTPNFLRYNEIGTNYSLNTIADIMIYAELSYLNSTSLYSNLIITYNTSLFEVMVQCNSIIKNPYERDDVIFGAIPVVMFFWNDDTITISCDYNNSAVLLDIKLITNFTSASVQLPITVNITDVGFLKLNITPVCSRLISTINIDSCFFNEDIREVLQNDNYMFWNGSNYWVLQCHNVTNDIIEKLDDCSQISDRLCPVQPEYTYANIGETADSSSSNYIFEETASFQWGVLSIVGGIALLVFILVVLLVLSLLVKKKRKKQEHIEMIESKLSKDDTYMQLSNRFLNVSRKIPSNDINHRQVNQDAYPDSDYSALKHIKHTCKNSVSYEALQHKSSPNCRPGLETDYAEIKTCHQCGHIKPYSEGKVKYSNISISVMEADKTLDLKSLVLHLSPISDKFKLFGSVAGICPTSLNMIIAECTSPYNALMKVCQLWLEKCRNEEVVPTWHAVAEILDLIGETKLSTEVLEVYAKDLVEPSTEFSNMIYDDIKTCASLVNEGHISAICEASDDEEPPPIPPCILEIPDIEDTSSSMTVSST